MGAARTSAVLRFGDMVVACLRARRDRAEPPDPGRAAAVRGLERVAGGVRRQAARRGSQVAVLTVDLVGFGAGADPASGGPYVADLLDASVRTADRVVRTSPDRFAVLLAADVTYALDAAERVHRGALRRLRRQGLAVRVGAAWRSVADCDGAADRWLPELLDEAARTPRFG